MEVKPVKPCCCFVCQDKLLLVATETRAGGRTVQAQQGAGTAVTVLFSKYSPVGGLSSPLIFAYALHVKI